jgi:hypothetical protein
MNLETHNVVVHDQGFNTGSNFNLNNYRATRIWTTQSVYQLAMSWSAEGPVSKPRNEQGSLPLCIVQASTPARALSCPVSIGNSLSAGKAAMT